MFIGDLKMQFKQKMVSASEVFDAYSGVCLADTTQTISDNLSKSESERYQQALMKVCTQKKLNRSDLSVFDRIDEITYKYHGMCLKDSQVTKARIKASKKYRIPFIDRDGLVEHMNAVNSNTNPPNDVEEYYFALGKLFQDEFGADVHHKLARIVQKMDRKEDLDLQELTFLSELEIFADRALDWSIVNPELRELIDKSCKKLGIYFQNLQNCIVH